MSVFRVTVILFMILFPVVYFLGTLLLFPAFSATMGMGYPAMGYGMGPRADLGLGVGAGIFSLFLGILFGFISSLLATIMAWLYNVIAGWVGGIRFRCQEEATPQS